MNVYGLNLWDDPEQYDEDDEPIETPSVDRITELWLAGELDDETFDAWMDAVDPGWDESTATLREERK